MIDSLLSTLAPHICSGCTEYGSILCKSCINDIENEDFGRCIWCTRPSAQGHQCQACRRAIGASGAWVVGERTEVLKRLLNDYKFESRREAATILAALLDATIPSLPADTVVTWVPTAPAHVRERGFDHARLLARTFAARRQLASELFLVRHGTQSQHTLNRRDRTEAAGQAFNLDNTSVPATILLVDDILTTGATMRACLALLKQAGAEVYVAVIARQPM